MFTGLIESIGLLEGTERRGANLAFRLRATPALPDLRIGESVAVDGYCLTVTGGDGARFLADVSPETLARTTAGQRRPGDRLNLERALRLGDRLGGHLVAGHVDGIGTIRRVTEQGGFVVLRIEAPAEILRYCVSKGSIAVDGVSLTINQVDAQGFELGIIPHTWEMTALSGRRPGDAVNLETDLIGKYVERFLLQRFPTGKQPPESKLTEEFLAEHGFLNSGK